MALDNWPVNGMKRVSETVKTKIMLGVYGCVPAFDEFVRASIGGFCEKNILKIGTFCTTINATSHARRLERTFRHSNSRAIQRALRLNGSGQRQSSWMPSCLRQAAVHLTDQVVGHPPWGARSVNCEPP